MSEILRGARHSPAPAENPSRILDASWLEYDVAKPPHKAMKV